MAPSADEPSVSRVPADAAADCGSLLRLHPPPVPDHELLRLIGRGSYGEVWLARNIMGMLRAIKVVYRGAFDEDRPFEREYAGLRRYEPVSRTHEGLVNILHVGRHEASQCFYSVMELADCATDTEEVQCYRPKTLRAHLNSRGPLPPEEWISLAIALASALSSLHKHGLVHRDLKPSNIIFVNGQPKLADIGLVAESGDSRSCVGTEGFFPREGPGSQQADLYGLGKLLYEAATGLDRLKFPQLPPGWIEGPRAGALAELNEVMLKACETDSARRYQSAEEMLADLALLKVGRSVRRLHGLDRRLRLARRFGLAAVGVAVLAMGGYGLAQRQAHRERELRRQVEGAEAQAREQLAAAKLSQARALVRTGEAGHRFSTLDVLAEAARTEPTLELRDEAIGALALVDLRLIRRLPLEGVSRAEPVMDRAGEKYVCGEPDGILSIRRVADDRELYQLGGGNGQTHWLPGFSPDGRYLAVRPRVDELAVWDLDSREKVLEVPAPSGQVYAQFTGDSRHLFYSAGARLIRRCELATGAITSQWRLKQPVWRFACSPDGGQLAIAYFTNLVEMLDLGTGSVIARLEHPDLIQALQWHRSKPLLATACHDQQVRVWNPLTGEELLILRGHQDTPASLDFHPTHPVMASSSWDGTTRLWDLHTGQELVVFQEAGDNLQFSANGQKLTLNEYSDAHVLVCELAVDPVCRKLQAPEMVKKGWLAMAFDPGGQLLLASDIEQIHIFNTETGAHAGSASSGRVLSQWFEPDGEHLVTSGDGGVLRWEVKRDAGGKVELREPSPVGHPGDPAGEACQSGAWLAWAHADHAHLRSNGLDVARFTAGGVIEHLAMSADAQWLALSTLRPGTVRTWRRDNSPAAGTTWSEKPSLAVSGSARLAFTPDHKFAVIGTGEEFVFWDLAAWKLGLRLPRFHTSTGAGRIVFSPDGKRLVVALSRTVLGLYNYPELKELASFEAPRATGVNGLCFDSVGRQLGVCSDLRQIQLWDLEHTHRELKAMGLGW